MKKWECSPVKLKSNERILLYRLIFTHKNEQRSFLASYDKETFKYNLINLHLNDLQNINAHMTFNNVRLVDIIDFIAQKMQ